jgi:tetratricopeptide (TPR) repeat protein
VPERTIDIVAVNKNKIVALAQRYTAKGQFEKAIAEYRKLLSSDPGDIRTWLKMGDLYTRMGARKEATETYFKVAEQYTKSGFHLKAIAVYKQVLNLDPTLVVIHKYLASSYLELGLTSEALIQLEQLADIYQRTGKKELLLETLLQMGNIDSRNIATRLRIAELLSEEKRIEEATRHFSIACEELKQQGRQDDYLKVAARLFYHDPSRVDVAKEIAEAYIKRRQFKEALSKLQACFVKNPKDVEVLELLAAAFKGLDQPDKAVSVYEEILGVLTDRDRRQEVLDEILELNPDHPKVQIWIDELASMHAPSETEEDSLSAIISPDLSEIPEGALRMPSDGPPRPENPDEAILNRSLGILDEVKVLLKYGMKERAQEHLSKIYEFDPYNIDARELNKDILLELGKTDEALEHLYLLADVFRDTQPEGSVYYLHEILKTDPFAGRAKRMIIELGGIMPEGIEATNSTLPEDDSDLLLEDEDDILLLDDTDGEPDEEITREAAVSLDEVDDWDDMEDPLLTAPKEPSMAPAAQAAAVGPSVPPSIPSGGWVREDNTSVEIIHEEIEVADEPLPDIDDDLEEIDFFISQELLDEARGVLEDLLAQYPNDPRLNKLKAGLAEQAEPGDAAYRIEQTSPPRSDDSVEFKHVGLQEKVSGSDAATNWDLGLAYKEMGLYEDAIQAFEVASRDSSRSGSAKTMIGMCYAALNRMDDALKTFEDGLKIEIQDPQQKMGLLYELGKTYQMMKRPNDAFDCFKKIYKMDKSFADIRSRIAALSGGKKRPATA